MKLALVVAMVACAYGSNVTGPFYPNPKPEYEYASFLWNRGGRDLLSLMKWEKDNMFNEEHVEFWLPSPCLPIPKELQ